MAPCGWGWGAGRSENSGDELGWESVWDSDRCDSREGGVSQGRRGGSP